MQWHCSPCLLRIVTTQNLSSFCLNVPWEANSPLVKNQCLKVAQKQQQWGAATTSRAGGEPREEAGIIQTQSLQKGSFIPKTSAGAGLPEGSNMNLVLQVLETLHTEFHRCVRVGRNNFACVMFSGTAPGKQEQVTFPPGAVQPPSSAP